MHGRARRVVCIAGLLTALLGAARAGEPPATPAPLPTLPPLPESEKAAEKGFRTDLGHSVVIEFRLIPAGTFVMGSPPSELGRGADEAPRTRVQLTRAYYIGTTEITQLQYELVMKDNPSDPQGGNYPVNDLTWAQAVEFGKRLTERERAAGRLGEKEEYRLPTEAEWERAARAGTDTRFGFGGVDAELTQNGWHLENAEETPHVVALLKPSPWELFDMHGNVWEWCADWYGPRYAGGMVTDPTGPAKGAARVMRGGSWADPASRCRSAARFSGAAKFASSMVGFRIVRTIEKAAEAPPPQP